MKRLLMFFMVLILLPLNAVSAEEPVVLSCIINFDWYPVKAFEGLIPQEIEKRTGVRLDVSIARSDQDILASIASGTLPDLIYTASLLNTLSNESLCYDYDSLISQYAPDWEIPDVLRQNALTYSSDQKLYTLLNHYTSDEDWRNQNTVPMCGSMLARQDVLDQLGNPDIQTVDDFFALLRRVQEQHPDIIPLVFSVSHRFKVFKYWYGIGELPFTCDENGSYQYYARDERYYLMLQALNRAFRNGYISLDNFVASDQEVLELFKAGGAFALSYCTQSLSGLNIGLAKVDPAFSSIELPPVEGAQYAVSEIGWAGTFISRNCKRPDVAIRFLQWMFTPEAQYLTQWGVEGRDYVLDEMGNPVFSQDVIDARMNNTYNNVYSPWFYFGGSAVVEAKGRLALGDYSSVQECYRQISSLYTNQSWQMAVLNPPNTKYYTIYNLAEDYVTQYEDQLITCETDEDFEYTWSQLQLALARINMESLEAYITEKAAEGAAENE